MTTDRKTNIIALSIVAVATMTLAGFLKWIGVDDITQIITVIVGALTSLGAVYGLGRSGTKKPLMIAGLIGGMAYLVVGVGCTQAQEDRGTLSGQPSSIKLTIAGHVYEGTQTKPGIETDENGFHRPDIDAVMTEIDGQIVAIRNALAEARADGDEETIDRLTEKLAALDLAKTAAAMGVTIVNVNDSGNIDITGSAETASPGDTTQTPTTETTPSVDATGLPGG